MARKNFLKKIRNVVISYHLHYYTLLYEYECTDTTVSYCKNIALVAHLHTV